MCVVADTNISLPTHLWIHISRSYGMPESMLIGPRLVARKKTKGICVMVTQAALKATSSAKCAVDAGASTENSNDATMIEYTTSARMLPEGRAVKL